MKLSSAGLVILILILAIIIMMLCSAGAYKYAKDKSLEEEMTRYNESFWENQGVPKVKSKGIVQLLKEGRKAGETAVYNVGRQSVRQNLHDLILANPPVNVVVQTLDKPNEPHSTGAQGNLQDLVSTRIENVSGPMADALRGIRGVDEECTSSSQCRGDLVCTKQAIYRPESYDDSMPSDLSGRKFVPFTHGDCLKDLGVVDLVEFKGSMICVIDDGTFRIISDNCVSKVSTEGHKFTDLAIENDTIHALDNGVVRRLSMGTYDTHRWLWKTIAGLPKDIESIEAPHDGSLLYCVGPVYSFTCVNGIVQQQTKSDGYKFFGESSGKYALAEGSKVTIVPSGNIINDISAVALTENNKVYTISNKKKNPSRFSHMKTFMGEPILITNSTCQPASGETMTV